MDRQTENNFFRPGTLLLSGSGSYQDLCVCVIPLCHIKMTNGANVISILCCLDMTYTIILLSHDNKPATPPGPARPTCGNLEMFNSGNGRIQL